MIESKRKRGRPAKVKQTDDDFHLILDIGNQRSVGKGKTVLEALLSLPKPNKIMLKGVLTVKQGEKVKEVFLQPLRIKRLFFPLARFQVAKELLVGLK